MYGLHAYDKKMINQLMQQTLVAEYPYQKIIQQILSLIVVSVLTSYKIVSMIFQTILRGVVLPISIR